MATIEQSTSIDERQEFMKGEGFVLYTDMSRRIIDHLGTRLITPITYERGDQYILHEHSGLNSSVLALHKVTRHLSQIPILEESVDGRCRWLGIDGGERYRASQFAYQAGTDDANFTWHFSAGLAAAAVYSFVDEGKMTKETAYNLSLGDWANIIGTGWFSTLTHQFALTGNGLLRSFGKNYNNFIHGSLRRYLLHAECLLEINYEIKQKLENAQLLDVAEKEEPDEGNIYLTASLNSAFRALLRDYRKGYTHSGSGLKSTGCPVARNATKLPAGHEESMPRAKKLNKLGFITISKSASVDGSILASQEWTAIDRTLSFFASQLRAYDRRYGTPKFTPDEKRIDHKHIPASESILFRPINN